MNNKAVKKRECKIYEGRNLATALALHTVKYGGDGFPITVTVCLFIWLFAERETRLLHYPFNVKTHII